MSRSMERAAVGVARQIAAEDVQLARQGHAGDGTSYKQRRRTKPTTQTVPADTSDTDPIPGLNVA